MTDATPAPATAPQPASGPANGEEQGALLRVLAQFTKDLSFENPMPIVQPGQAPPEIELGIDVRVEPGSAEDQVYGVDLKLTAKAMRGDKIVFLVELVYAGVFQIQDARPQDIEPLLLIECPRLLFPFARRVIAEMTREGGHPPLMIDPIDFAGLYRRQRAAADAPAAAS